MFGPLDFLLGGLAPLAAAAIAFAVVWKLSRRAGAAWSAGLVVGYAVGTLALEARDTGLGSAAMRLIRASESHEWLTLMALAATAPAAVAAATRRLRVEVALAAPLCIAAPLGLLWNKYRASEQLRAAGFADDAISPGGAALILAAVAAGLLAAWWLWRQAEGAPLARTRSLLAIIATTGAAATAALTGALVYGQALGVLAAALGGCAAAAWILGETSGPEAARGPTLVIFGGLVAAAACYSALPPWQAAVLGAAMVLPVGWLPGADRMRPLRQVVLRLALCLLPLTLVVWRAVDDFIANEQQQKQEQEDDPYSDYQKQ
jgi:hypothetical protein